MSEIILTADNFDETLKSDKPVLVDFFATWCGPCQMMSPFVSKLADEHKEIIVGKLNVDDARSIAERYHVMSIPTFLLFKNGVPANKAVGAMTEADLERFALS